MVLVKNLIEVKKNKSINISDYFHEINKNKIKDMCTLEFKRLNRISVDISNTLKSAKNDLGQFSLAMKY